MESTSNNKCILEALPATIVEGGVVVLRAKGENINEGYEWCVDAGTVKEVVNVCEDLPQNDSVQVREAHWDTTGLPPGNYKATFRYKPNNAKSCSANITVISRQLVRADVTLQRSPAEPTDDQALWVAIRNRTGALDFTRYQKFIDCVFCEVHWPPKLSAEEKVKRARRGMSDLERQGMHLGEDLESCIGELPTSIPTIHGPYAYMVLKLATQVFLILECGVKISERLFDPAEEKIRLDELIELEEIKKRLEDYLVPFLGTNGPNTLPYLRRILDQLIELDRQTEKELPCYEAILKHRLSCPSLLELIWSYWHEEGMLVQTMNAIVLRFQNRSRAGGRDPLANLEIDSLRPLNNLLWGFIQDEYNRLTVPRRAYEYDHHYGLTLVGKAVPKLSPADSRSKFIEGFHNLLYRASAFFREDADTTVHSDGFPLLNALREVHLLLAEGAHNQFGDLPWTARAEMLTMQWLLARPEIREFLRGRAMVPYREGWMGQVDTMKRLQGWTDTTITHFHNMGRFGEQILLSVRYGDWIEVDDQEHAKNWARYWRPEIQGYTHAYQAATGVDLAADIVDNRQAAVRYIQPSTHLHNRLTGQRAQGRLPVPQAGRASEVRDYAELTTVFHRRLPRY